MRVPQEIDGGGARNDRRKVLWGLDDGNVIGSRRFSAHVSAVLLVHLACATLRLSPVAKKRHDLTAAERAALLA